MNIKSKKLLVVFAVALIVFVSLLATLFAVGVVSIVVKILKINNLIFEIVFICYSLWNIYPFFRKNIGYSQKYFFIIILKRTCEHNAPVIISYDLTI